MAYVVGIPTMDEIADAINGKYEVFSGEVAVVVVAAAAGGAALVDVMAATGAAEVIEFEAAGGVALVDDASTESVAPAVAPAAVEGASLAVVSSVVGLTTDDNAVAPANLAAAAHREAFCCWRCAILKWKGSIFFVGGVGSGEERMVHARKGWSKKTKSEEDGKN